MRKKHHKLIRESDYFPPDEASGLIPNMYLYYKGTYWLNSIHLLSTYIYQNPGKVQGQGKAHALKEFTVNLKRQDTCTSNYNMKQKMKTHG